MRIISGTARGKRLSSFTGKEIRPTPDRVRGAIFSILYSRLGGLEGKMVLDLFAGTGSMGLEALSRGAGAAVFVDQGAQAARIIRANLKACALEEKGRLVNSDVLKALPALASGGPYDLVLLDPPYDRGLAAEAISAISDLGLLAGNGLVCAETSGSETVPDAFGDLVRIDRRTYGSTAVHLYTHSDREASS